MFLAAASSASGRDARQRRLRGRYTLTSLRGASKATTTDLCAAEQDTLKAILPHIRYLAYGVSDPVF